MKAKDIVQHKVTNEVGFILCIREDLVNRCDIQWSFEYVDNSTIPYSDKYLINQGCYPFDELEVIYSVLFFFAAILFA